MTRFTPSARIVNQLQRYVWLLLLVSDALIVGMAQAHAARSTPEIINANVRTKAAISNRQADCQPPVVTLTPASQTICIGFASEIITASVQGGTATAYKWYGPLSSTAVTLGEPLPNEIEDRFEPAGEGPGTYYYAVVVQSGPASCSAVAYAKIVVSNYPEVVPLSVSACGGEPVDALTSFSVANGPPAQIRVYLTWEDFYAEQNALTNPIISLSATTTLFVAVTNVAGCFYEGETDITISPKPIDLSLTSTCTSASGGTGRIMAMAMGDNIEYRIDNGAFQRASLFSNVADGTHIVEARTVGTTCSVTATAVVSCNCSPPVLTVQNPPARCAPATIDITSVAVISQNTGVRTLYYTNLSDANAGGNAGRVANPAAVATSGTYYIRSETNSATCFVVKPVSVTIQTCNTGCLPSRCVPILVSRRR